MKSFPFGRKHRFQLWAGIIGVQVIIGSFVHLHAASATLTIDADKPGHSISPTLYGIFFEDINCSADGGLYGELVRNRNFEDASKPDHWSVVSSGLAQVVVRVDSTLPVSPKNPHSLQVRVQKPGTGRA